jgi:Flp pilus assembly protein TadG
MARHGSETGQAMVEFMLVIVFLFVLFLSIFQIILLMHAYSTLADAAKEGVRYAIVHGTNNSQCSGPNSSTFCGSPDPSPYQNVQNVVINFALTSFQNLSASEVTVSYNPQDENGTCANGACTTGTPPVTLLGCNAPGCMVRVSVSHTYRPFFGFSWPRITLNAAAEGRIMN